MWACAFFLRSLSRSAAAKMVLLLLEMVVFGDGVTFVVNVVLFFYRKIVVLFCL